MRRAFIVAPNIGLSLGGGGGVKVALYMAQTLLENNVKVHLVALGGWSIEKLDKIHGTKLRVYYREGKLILNYMLGMDPALHIPFPIAVKLIVTYVEQLCKKFNPDLIIFHDDVLRINERVFNLTSGSILYSHFPYAARVQFNVVDAVEIGLEKYQSSKTRLYYQTLKKAIFTQDLPKEVLLIANSTITRMFTKILWKRDAKILYPPLILQPRRSVVEKSNTIVLVGGQPNKRICDAIKALAEMKKRHDRIPKLRIVSHHFISWYKEWLITQARKFNVKQHVFFIENISIDHLSKIYDSSKAILSVAHFEPFGMSVVEGMAFGNIPIVYKSTLSGPWIDIIGKGRYGVGFRTINELAEVIYDVMNFDRGKLEEWQNKVVYRSNFFSLEIFKDNFIKIVGI